VLKLSTDLDDQWEYDLLRNIGLLFDAQGFGTYSESVTVAEPLITMMNVPSSPDRLISIGFYGQVLQHVSLAIGTVPLQVRTRGRANRWDDVVKMATPIFQLLHGREGLILGEVHCPSIERVSMTPLGQDGNKRWERTDNYHIMVDLPTTANRE
jgi:hypothetical protein